MTYQANNLSSSCLTYIILTCFPDRVFSFSITVKLVAQTPLNSQDKDCQSTCWEASLRWCSRSCNFSFFSRNSLSSSMMAGLLPPQSFVTDCFNSLNNLTKSRPPFAGCAASWGARIVLPSPNSCRGRFAAPSSIRDAISVVGASGNFPCDNKDHLPPR